MSWARPLAGVRSIKLKLSIVIVVAVAGSTATSLIGYRLGWPLWIRPLVAGAFGLVLAQLLGRGMTRPLRELARAAGSMASGDYSVRVTTSSADEVGRLAGAFNAMAAELAQLDRQRRDLIANVSHELRTPLGGLTATLENLLDGVSAPDPHVLATMAAQTQRLGRLVNDLLDLSRLESGCLQLRIERVQVADVFDSVLSEARLHHPDLADPSHLAVTATVDPAELSCEADPERLHQVLANLVDNAVRHGGHRGQSVTVVLSGQALADGSVMLAVTDNGPGVEPADQQRVFERFYRADRARTGDGGGGAGLGLAIARWVVELHGGRIAVEDAPGGGARVTVVLPATPRHVRRPFTARRLPNAAEPAGEPAEAVSSGPPTGRRPVRGLA
ncbi:MAG: sensor histidine kinase [Acidimicrobiales bacterium]